MGNATISSSIIVPSRMVFLMWAVFSAEMFLQIDLSIFGIYPRVPLGLIGVLTSPLLHGNVVHLSSNTLPLLFLGTTLYFFYPRIAARVFYQCYLVTGLLVWLFARATFHIGASGVIYGLASFLVFYGFFSKDFKSLVISVVIMFFYWSLIYGILPTQPGVSWESHLIGGIVGFMSAMYFGKKGGMSRY